MRPAETLADAIRAERPAQPRRDGVAGNARLTGGAAAMLLVLLALEGATIPLIGSLRGPHIFIGMLLIPPVLLKLGSTSYRFLRYYTRNPSYLRKGPPHLLMRLLAPGVVIASLALFATGVLLLIDGPGSGSLNFLHKASFILWFALMTVHVLGHILEVPALAIPDWRSKGGREAQLAGSGLRLALLGMSLLAGPSRPITWPVPGSPATELPVGEHDVSFDAMGSHLRLLIGEPGLGMAPAPEAAAQARRFVTEFDGALSRFKSGSELCALNEDPRERVPASELLRGAVKAGLAAAERSGGLVDPTLIGEMESVGYVASRAGVPGAPLGAALAQAPPRHPARPSPDARWRRFEVDDTAGTIARPPGIRFDTGGAGKGLAADTIATGLRGYSRFVVNCGGDIRIGGGAALLRPYDVLVEHPLTGQRPYALRLGSGAVATSGLGTRIWRNADGRYAHHLLDPSTGEPAWTGLIGATALGETTLEAETLAKAALLSGPDGGRTILAERGGLLVHDSGRVETVGPLSARRVPATGSRPRAPASLAVRRTRG